MAVPRPAALEFKVGAERASWPVEAGSRCRLLLTTRPSMDRDEWPDEART